MPFDENGIFQQEIYHQPQTGALAGLDIFNQFKSAQNARDAQLLKQYQILMQTLRDPNAGALTQNPMASQVTGMTQDDLSQTYGQTPRGQFQSQYAAATPEQQNDPDFMQHLGISTGAEPWSAATSYYNTMTKTAAQNERAKNTLAFKYTKADLDFAKDQKDHGATPEDIAASLTYFKAVQAGTPEDQLPPISATVLPLVRARMDLMQATGEERKAQGGLAAAKTEQVAPLAEAKIGLEKSQTGLNDARTQLTALTEEVKRQIANGAVDPKTLENMDFNIGKLSDSMVKARENLKKMKPGDPQKAMAVQNLAQMQSALNGAVNLHNSLKRMKISQATAAPSEPGSATAPSAPDKEETGVSKSGRPMKRVAGGPWVYADGG